MSKYKIAASLAALCVRFNRMLGYIENKTYRVATSAQATAYDHGVLESQARVNKAQANVQRARLALELTTNEAKAVLREHPSRVEAVRTKVYG